MNRALQVSAVIITFNEEVDIARALDSVAWCDEVLVVDSGSTDKTVEICRAHGCRVIHHDFAGYGEQKAFAVTQATHDWVLVLDADEQISDALRDEILSRMANPGDCHGFTLPITTVLWDQVIRMDRRHTKAKLRLFDRRFGRFRDQLVHESVTLQSPAEPLQQPMYNYSYASITDYFDKFNQYTSLAARECVRRGKRPGLLGTMVRLPLTFVQLYFIKGFVHDGLTGLQWSLFSSLYPAVKDFKAGSLARAEKQTIAQKEQIPLLGRRRDWRSAFTRIRQANATAYVLAPCFIALAMLPIVLIQGEDTVDDFMLLLAAVVATASFGCFGASALATLLGAVCLDYFVLAPKYAFSLNSTGLVQLSLFIGIALLTSSLVYARRRPFSR